MRELPDLSRMMCSLARAGKHLSETSQNACPGSETITLNNTISNNLLDVNELFYFMKKVRIFFSGTCIVF